MKKYTFGTLETIQSISDITDLPLFSNSNKTTVFLDVDNTLIIPRDLFFRHNDGNNQYRTVFDDLKVAHQKNEIEKSFFEKVLGHWRLQRKTDLVESIWPKVIQDFKHNNISVCALTHIHTGQFGPVDSMEAWRYHELKKHNIIFSNILSTEQATKFNQQFNPNASYFNGIFITENIPKDTVIEALIQKAFIDYPSLIVFIDDRKALVEQFANTLEKLKIHFLACHYTAAHYLPGKPDPKIAEFQKKALFEHLIWYSDALALKKIQSSS